MIKLCPTCSSSYPDDYQTCPRDQTALIQVEDEIAPGTVLRGKYEVISELGKGGMATVYKVRHKAFHEILAIKVVHPQFMQDPNFVKRFRNEAIVARQLKHKNAVRIDDFDYAEDGRPFIVMEFVEGRSLFEVRRERPGAWPIARCINVVCQAAAALGAAHDLGIVHRDIKPSNILLLRGSTGIGQVKVLDFGIAKVADDTFAGMTSVRTQQSLIIGTPEYMSPEQASGRAEGAVDGRADLYSLGLVFYEMLTGSHPFQADTPIGMVIHQLHTPPPPPSSFAGASVSPAISMIVLKSLQKNPDDRFQTAAEMIEALNNPDAWMAAMNGTPLPQEQELAATAVYIQIPAQFRTPATTEPTPVNEPSAAFTPAPFHAEGIPPQTPPPITLPPLPPPTPLPHAPLSAPPSPMTPPPLTPAPHGYAPPTPAPATYTHPPAAPQPTPAPVGAITPPPMAVRLPIPSVEPGTTTEKLPVPLPPRQTAGGPRSTSGIGAKGLNPLVIGGGALAAIVLLVILFFVFHSKKPAVVNDAKQATPAVSAPPVAPPPIQTPDPMIVSVPGDTPPSADPAPEVPAGPPVFANQGKVDRLIVKGNQYLAAGKNDLATKAFNQVLALNPGNADARAGLVKAHPAVVAGPRPAEPPPPPPPVKSGPPMISAGVMNALLTAHPEPVYPADAGGAQGEVVMRATISKAGAIEDLSALSGPDALRLSALQAVTRWHWKPYTIDGEPAEVQTIITVTVAPRK